MNQQDISKETRDRILVAQGNEITEYHIYRKICRFIDDKHNQDIMMDIADDELRHYNFWKDYTGEDVKPNRFKIWFYYLISIVFGVTFGIQLMEKGEEAAQKTYLKIAKEIPEAKRIVIDEDEHEKELIELMDEERLKYVGSMVLGLNDALVELTGALAGYTLAMQNTNLIAMAGLITGIAASFSMAASEYLSTKSKEGEENPIKASIYTGGAYILTVILLILPYLILSQYFLSLVFTLVIAVLIIIVFNFYISVAKNVSFKDRFTEMASISLGVAGLSFGIGFIIRHFMGIEV